jgi:hypothetical protein
MRRYPILLGFCIAVVAVGAFPAAAAEMPPRKAGLWELKMIFARNAPPTIMQQCTDAETDKLMHSASGGTGQETCANRDITNVGGQMVIDSVCTIGGKTITSHAVITGSLDSAYVMNVTTKSEGGPLRPGEVGDLNMTLEGKWLGPCKADQRPGDMIMPGGMKMNVRDFQNVRPPGGAGGQGGGPGGPGAPGGTGGPSGPGGAPR